MTRRLARARELLERTDRSALDIALDVGFKTPSHFTSRFRREFGVTPREIRADSRRPDERLDLDLDLVDPTHRQTRTMSATARTSSSAL
jgi:AraC-like DNA-binding protein